MLYFFIEFAFLKQLLAQFLKGCKNLTVLLFDLLEGKAKLLGFGIGNPLFMGRRGRVFSMDC